MLPPGPSVRLQLALAASIVEDPDTYVHYDECWVSVVGSGVSGEATQPRGKCHFRDFGPLCSSMQAMHAKMGIFLLL